jgi:nicotinate phosphoribosyltransferase
MIHSILDNDLYKFTLQQVILHNFPNAEVEYDLAIRSKNIDLRPFREEIQKEIDRLPELIMNTDEYNYLNTIRFLSKDYIDWLKNYAFNPDKHVFIYEKNNNLAITIKGRWLDTILYEVPVLAIISEVYHSRGGLCNLGECTRRLEEKIKLIKSVGKGFVFSEFGTRRRNSYLIQDHVLNMLINEVPENLIGTSNVHLAMKYGVKSIGSMPHEGIMCCQSLFPISTHQSDFFDMWMMEFDGDVGIALSDTLGVDRFFKDFKQRHAKVYDGIRHDSGDPIKFGYKAIEFYKKNNINPKNKTLIFSDSLNFSKAIMIYNEFCDKINNFFGIGTNLTNDCGDEAISIVIKVQECNGMPVAKISDTPEKSMCRNNGYLEFIKWFALQ